MSMHQLVPFIAIVHVGREMIQITDRSGIMDQQEQFILGAVYRLDNLFESFHVRIAQIDTVALQNNIIRGSYDYMTNFTQIIRFFIECFLPSLKFCRFLSATILWCFLDRPRLWLWVPRLIPASDICRSLWPSPVRYLYWLRSKLRKHDVSKNRSSRRTRLEHV